MKENEEIEEIRKKNHKRPDPEKINNSWSLNKIVSILAKASTWLQLTLVPIGLSVVIGAIVIYNSRLTWSDGIMLLFPIGGAIAGILFATYISKKFDLEEIAYKDISSSDIDDLTHPKKKE